MPKILHVVSYFPPDRLGGVGEVVAHIHQGLKAAGHESVVLTSGVSSDDPSIIRVARSPTGFSFGVLSQLSRTRTAAVVHIHHGEGVLLLLAMRLLGIRTPVLLTMHVSVAVMRHSLGPYTASGYRFHQGSIGNWFYRHVTMRMRALMDWLALKLATQASFISRSSARDVLGEHAVDDARFIYNGVTSPDDVSPESIDSAQPANSTDSEGPADTSHSTEPVDLLYVGANSERKRVELLPLVLQAVRKQRPDARLRIAGFDQADNSELCSLAAELGVLHAIDFAGRFPSTELGRHYRSARVLMVPSAYEGLPMVILEAMQHDLPVIATRVSGHPEVIEDGVSGLLVPLDDTDAMALAALRILEDTALASDLAAAARSRVEKDFSVDKQVGAYLSLYEELASR